MIYVRSAGRTEERVLPGHPLHDFGTQEHRRALASLLAELGVASSDAPTAGAAVG